MRSPEAIVTEYHQRTFGNTGLHVPPIVFDAGVLGNARSVLPEQTRFEIFGEWIRRVAPPVFVQVDGRGAVAQATCAFLGRAIQRFEVALDEVMICVNIPWHDSHRGVKALLEQWTRSCAALGMIDRPRLAAVELSVDSPVMEQLTAVTELKIACDLAGLGIMVSEWQHVPLVPVAAEAAFDWIFCNRGPSLIDSMVDRLAAVPHATEHALPIVVGNVFAGDFLVGGHNFNGRAIDPLDTGDQALLAWRKSFVALCHGHGIGPAHACVQFALRQPGVISIVAETAHADMVSENARFAVTPVPDAFWDALAEEGLLRGWPH